MGQCTQCVMLHGKNSESKKLMTLPHQQASQLFVPEVFTSPLQVVCCRHNLMKWPEWEDVRTLHSYTLILNTMFRSWRDPRRSISQQRHFDIQNMKEAYSINVQKLGIMPFLYRVMYSIIKIYFVSTWKKITENKNQFTKISYKELRVPT